MTSPPAYRLVRPPAHPVQALTLDTAQQAVVDHPGGPLLVLAGPGTGKTTTLVESVVARVRSGLDPERMLVLTFGRRAAADLRARVAGRLGQVTREPLALTFHSYAFALLRAEASRAGTPPPRLLSGPEQDLEIRRLLRGDVDDGARDWPTSLRPALLTRGFAEALRDLLLRAQERGFDGPGLAALGRQHDRPEWVACGGFLSRYTARFDLDPAGPALDYAELVRQAAELVRRPDVLRRERELRQAVFVDEYQDTDPAQERLLQALAGGGRDLVVVGDPDQSIYGFRGAEIDNILAFPDRFRTARGEPAPVVSLSTCRRFGGLALVASRRVASLLPAGQLRAGHRDLQVADAGAVTSVEVHLADSASAEAGLVAGLLRRAHLQDGVPWSAMAVLVRSAVAQVPVLRRALGAVGVPVTVAGDEVPLVMEPAVRPLLLLLRCALSPSRLDEVMAVELLTGQLGGGDVLAVRRLRRALREIELAAGRSRPPGDLLVASLLGTGELSQVRDRARRPAERVAHLLATARAAVATGGSAEDVLWAMWQASGLAGRWERAALDGGPIGAAADRDLDAAVALFDAAARFVDRLPGASAELFLDDLEAQEIPGDTLAEQAPSGDAVRLLTAHRAKGLEWDVVVVAGVQAGRWPDLRLRGSLLGTEELVDLTVGRTPSQPGVTQALLQEERRLFYVAATRARRRLVVTAVGCSADAEERPSRFLDELLPGASVAGARAAVGAPPRLLALPVLVAELRAAVCDDSTPCALREQAAGQLARLAAAGVSGAAPQDWQVLTEVSDATPLFDADAEVRLSPSQVEGFDRCGLRWLLDKAVGAAAAPGPAQSVGNLVHALAALLDTDDDITHAALVARLDTVWSELDLGARWFADKQRDRAITSLQRVLDYQAASGRELVRAEQAIAVQVQYPTSAGVRTAAIKGRIDRVERDEQGRACIVDLKTGSSKPSKDELARLPQLGVYQLAVVLGGLAEIGLHEPGGAALVQLGRAGGKSQAGLVQWQPALDLDGGWALELLARVAQGMRQVRFAAQPGEDCDRCPVRACCPAYDEGVQVVR